MQSWFSYEYHYLLFSHLQLPDQSAKALLMTYGKSVTPNVGVTLLTLRLIKCHDYRGSIMAMVTGGGGSILVFLVEPLQLRWYVCGLVS